MISDPASRAGAILDIDLGGIVENWRLLARQAAPALCAAVVKANAYGLGAAPVARALAAAGCRMFFVATLDEGMLLRQALGPAPEIAVFNGPLPGTAAHFLPDRLIPVLNEPGQIEASTFGQLLGQRPRELVPAGLDDVANRVHLRGALERGQPRPPVGRRAGRGNRREGVVAVALRDGADQFAGREFWQIFAPLRLAAVGVDRLHHQR